MLRKLTFVLVLVMLIVPTAFVGAQGSGLDPAAAPNYGGAQIPAPLFDFLNPFVTTIVSGGTESLATGAGTGCTGFGTSAPDYLFEIQDSYNALRVMFLSEGDTTLAVLSPDGNFYCNDDGIGLNPVVNLTNPVTGVWTVWVGSLQSDTYNAGFLLISPDALVPGSFSVPLLTELSGADNSSVAPIVVPSTLTSQTSGTTTTTTNPVNTTPVVGGAVTLASGFSPDPFTTPITSGGEINVSTLNLGAGCLGFVTQQPNLILNWSGTSANLRIFFNSAGDSTLVVVGPNNQVYCNDDYSGGGLDPLVDIANPAAGAYSIFVGSFGGATANPGTLYVTEFTTIDPNNSP